MAEFDSVQRRWWRRRNARAKRATKRSTRTVRFRLKSWPRRSGFTRRGSLGRVDRRPSSAAYGIPHAVLDFGGSYPVNVGGRPYHSWPAFIVVTFEMTILFAGISAVFGMLALNGLPMPYHPVFNVPRFALATKDRFFLIVFSSDPEVQPDGNTRFWKAWGRVPSRRCPIKRLFQFSGLGWSSTLALHSVTAHRALQPLRVLPFAWG